MPEISVLMCVYNGEKYLAEAVESILAQSFSDFEFVIVDDGSTDRSHELLDAYAQKDSRIKLIHQPQNMGITLSVTHGLQYCTGKYIARMDQDDVSLPGRLQAQYQFLKRHSEIDAVGAGFVFIDEAGNQRIQFPTREADPLIVRLQMFYHCMLHNPSVMMTSAYYKKYNQDHLEENYYGADDYHFWLRMNNVSYYSNIPDVLLYYRRHQVQVSNKDSSSQLDSILRSAHEVFQAYLGRSITHESVKTFYFISRFTTSEPGCVREAIRVIYQTQMRFENLNSLSKEQKEKTRIYSYEKLKSVVVKYKSFRAVFLMGMLYLVRLLPGRVFMDLFVKMGRDRSAPNEED